MRYRELLLLPLLLASFAACQPTVGGSDGSDVPVNYCSVETPGARVEVVRPGPGEEPIDDVNWFARPVPNESGDWIVAFASHDQNYLYNLTQGTRVKIPDRSDAVATPDGRYMTVPSNYTPDETIRFYDTLALLEHLDRGEDADQLPPLFAHEHPDLSKVYYQSTGIVSESDASTVYRLMFSGTASESGFRIVDYTFTTDGSKLEVSPTEPMKLCPEIPNDLNTPFISKDARYVVSYTSSSKESAYSTGSSLQVFRIAETFPAEGTTRCEPVLDFGFAAGKADFAYDNSQLTFHISKGSYLTPFVDGGLDAPTVTDVVIVNLTQDDAGDIVGYSGMARITTSLEQGVGSYFPAFLPDGNLFYVANAVPKKSEAEKRFSFKVVDPSAETMMANVFADPATTELASSIASLWQSACSDVSGDTPKTHEAPWILTSLSPSQCRSLVEEQWSPGLGDKDATLALCASL